MGNKAYLGGEWERREVCCNRGEIKKESLCVCSFEIGAYTQLLTNIAVDHKNRSRELFAGWWTAEWS